MQKKKGKLHELDVKSNRGFKPKLFTKKFTVINRYKKLKTASTNNATKKLHKRFKGGKMEHVKKLSLERLAAYGLDKRNTKNKNKKESKEVSLS